MDEKLQSRALLAEFLPSQLPGAIRRVLGPRRPVDVPAALFEESGPDEPWPFAATDHWACDDCALHERCPGGAGL
jgi:hypothetical protein